jgi:hypothetical protein
MLSNDNPWDNITYVCNRRLLFCRDISAGVPSGEQEDLVDLAGAVKAQTSVLSNLVIWKQGLYESIFS